MHGGMSTSLRPPQQPRQHDSRSFDGCRGQSVGWSTMDNGSKRYSSNGILPEQQQQQRQQHHKLTTTGPISIIRDAQTSSKRAQREVHRFASANHVFPPTPPLTDTSSSSSRSYQDHAGVTMELAAAQTASLIGRQKSPSSMLLDKRRPFQQRHGRRYTRDPLYPLPCDLPELNRQNLRTSLACTTFGTPICSPDAVSDPPSRVLELGCGTGYWSASCHQAYSSMGLDTISFTGMDIVPVAPDLRKQGLSWTFVQHDIRRTPWPFEDESFDFIMWKDLSLVVSVGMQCQRVLDECMRVLRTGGILEIWEYDNLVRSIQPHTSPVIKDKFVEEAAANTATIPIHPSTPFAPTQNRYLKAANKWIDSAATKRGLISAPCARMASVLVQQSGGLADLGVRRVAIPLSILPSKQDLQGTAKRPKRRSPAPDAKLSQDQLALRQTALLTIVQSINSLEPLLKESSGKNNEEWSYWWASMMTNFSDIEKKPFMGECLELGAWWATKL